jgi:hypothetical protein
MTRITRRFVVVAVAALAALVASTRIVSAQECDLGGGASTPVRVFAEACRRAGGVPNGCSCDKQAVGSPATINNSDGNDDAARRAREAAAEQAKHEAELERQRREAEALRRQEEAKRRFIEERDAAAATLKGENNTGVNDGLKGSPSASDTVVLKGYTGTNGFGLKTATPEVATPPECEWGDQDPPVVDLRCLGLDTDKPITVDWHVIRGQQRAFPAQIDPATFQNANYKKGFAALMQPPYSIKEAEDAVTAFKSAKLQRPNDPLVRNALYLAEGILEGRQRKEQEGKFQAEQQLYQGIATLLMGDLRTASVIVERAQKLDPASGMIRDWSRMMEALNSNYPGKTIGACSFIGYALLFEATGDNKSEIRTLVLAARLYPNDAFIKTLLWRAEHRNPASPTPSSMTPGVVTKHPSGNTLKPNDSSGPHN